jgi:hypothetical protein
MSSSKSEKLNLTLTVTVKRNGPLGFFKNISKQIAFFISNLRTTLN